MIDLTDIKIVFFDVGNVFVSDDPSGCFAYRCLYDRICAEGNPLTIDEFFRLRTEHVKAGGGLWSFVGQYVPEVEFKQWQLDVRRKMYDQWGALSPAIASMADVPEKLAPYYRLGIIANQPAEVEDVLAERGIVDKFEVLAISDKLRLFKPDPELYRWAVREAGVEPHETLMVGDRIDNDVRPAKSVGMRTAWLRLGYDNREWQPEDEFQACYSESIVQASYSEAEPTDDEDMPDLMVHSAEELVNALVPVGQRLARR